MSKRALAAFALAAAFGSPLARASELDGTVWRMRLTGFPQAVMFWRADTLRFDDGQFTSSACVPFGFKSTPYNGGASWSAEQTNDKGERMLWKGTRSGGTMTGTYAWTRGDGKVKTYRWRARLIAAGR